MSNRTARFPTLPGKRTAGAAARRLFPEKTSASVLDLSGPGRQDPGHAAGDPSPAPTGSENQLKSSAALKATAPSGWSVADSADLYGIKSWGAGYFDLADD